MRAASSRRLHTLAVGLAAFTLFLAQPLAARTLLPRLGGTPAVWNAVALFFQLALLFGYGFAHRVAGRFSTRSLAWIYALGVSSAAAWVWLAPPLDTLGQGAEASTWAVMLSLGAALGLPALFLATSTPLWSRSFDARGLGDPYPLYAASNAGSLLALLAYPAFLEPWLGLRISFSLWAGCLSLLALVAWAGLWRAPSDDASLAPVTQHANWSTRARWTLLAAGPSALLLALTVHITTDLAPVPWLWVLPLCVYLGSWILAFATRGERLRRLIVRTTPLAAAAVVPLLVLEATRPTFAILAATLFLLFMLASGAHIELARRKPPPQELTDFYMALALGGVMGALLVSHLLPALFDRNFDVALLVALALWFAPRPTTTRDQIVKGAGLVSLLLIALGAWLFVLAQGPARPGGSISLAAFALWLPLFWPSFRWPRVAARVLAFLVVGGVLSFELAHPPHRAARSAMGAYRVVDDAKGQTRKLTHGRINHGEQSEAPGFEGMCLPYHHPASPIAEVFDSLARRKPVAQVAVLGLGIGGMAVHSRPAWRMRFYEIDPLVEELAREEFHFLADCPSCEVVIGDGRRKLSGENDSDRLYDLIVLDAFSSDAIPTHLLTREAFEGYLEHLAPEGWLAVHITNRHVDLRGALAQLAQALQLDAQIGEFNPKVDGADLFSEQERARLAPTRWVLLSRQGEARALDWDPLPSAENAPLWTDDHASLVRVLADAESQ